MKEKMMTNAMFNLEHSTEDKVKVSKLAPTLTRLEDIRDKWDDDFAINQKLRKKFRTEKREIQDKEVCEGFFFFLSRIGLVMDINENFRG
ncbi:MAG: Saf4/Yju2 family protein, partial [Cyanobacteria bacterium J06649_11]